MNNIEMKYIVETDQYSINGELWCRAEPVKEKRKLYFSKPITNMTYFYIDKGVERTSWDGNRFDQCKYNTLNCWLDKSEVKAYLQRYGIYLPDKLTLAIRRWKIENEVEDRFDWEDENDKKYSILYSFNSQEWKVDYDKTWRSPNVEYFRDPETAQKCLNDLPEYFDDQLNEWNDMNSGIATPAALESEGE